MLVLLRRQWKLFPVTMMLLVVSVAFYVASRAMWAATWAPYGAGRALQYLAHESEMGVLEQVASELMRVEGGRVEAAMARLGAVGLTGVWDGQIWRLVGSGFHHGSLMHLVGNLVGLALLGVLVEPRCPRWAFVGFCILSSTISILAEALLQTPSVGLSGTGFAMFGYLVVLRRRDPALAMQLTGRMVTGGFIAIFLCIPITMLGWVPIANVAHFAGLGYGVVAGWSRVTRRPRLVLSGFALGHLLLIPACFAVVSPTWSDAYVRYRIGTADDTEEVIEWLQLLLERRPDRASIRWRLAYQLHTAGRSDEAWELAVAGWTSQDQAEQRRLWGVIQSLWVGLPDEDARIRAEQVMEQSLGSRIDQARDGLDLEWLSVVAVQSRKARHASDPTDIDDERIRVDPDRPDSAAAGRQL